MARQKAASAEVREQAAPAKCNEPTKWSDAPCWLRVANQPSCYLWAENIRGRDSVEWSGQCKNGVADGHGGGIWRNVDDNLYYFVTAGSFVDGKRRGSWVEWMIFVYTGEAEEGFVGEGAYVDGKRHGYWVTRHPDGDVYEEGHYVNGEEHGKWVSHPFGDVVWESDYVNGKRHGYRIVRNADGTVVKRECWENGKEVDC